ncbi:MAG: T9SS type A sorting domain-containing protein [Lewinellaceae bacterium]|nr:T9SS type A sorting domain-containing protein [Lewinellaceae bacterium]
MTKLNPILYFLFLSSSLFAQPTLVKNIQPGLGSSVFLSLEKSAVAGNYLYFMANDDVHGFELWKSDGTAAGTVMVRDIFPGKSQDGPQQLYAAYKNQLYFTARDTTHETELWRTDDAEGAVLLTDACPGTCDGAQYFQPLPMAVYQDKLYFRSLTPGTGQELWVTEGDSAGAMLVKDIDPGGTDSNPYLLTVFQDKLYFVCDSANWGRELWVTDGTEAGTRPVKNINPTLSFSVGDSGIDGLVIGPDALYFWAKSDNATGKELWKSDGTEPGTVIVKDINPGSGNGASGKPLNNSAWLGSDLIFVANDGATGEELWITDGTEAGTMLLADINPGASGSGIQIFGAVNGSVLFKANDGSTGYELWITDGTSAGTVLLKDILPGTFGSFRSFDSDFIVFQNKLFFTAEDGVTGRELWISDGTPDGTMLFADVASGSTESIPSHYRLIGNTLFFFAQTNATGRELWKYDLSSVGTKAPESSLPFELNPTVSNTGIFNLVLDRHLIQSGSYRLEVHDLTGQLRTSRTLAGVSQAIDLSALPSGAYFVRVLEMQSNRNGIKKVFILK